MCAEKPIICFRQKHFRRITKRSKRQTYPHSIMNCLISKILKKRKQINKSSMHTHKKYTQNKLDKQQKPANTILSHSHINTNDAKFHNAAYILPFPVPRVSSKSSNPSSWIFSPTQGFTCTPSIFELVFSLNELSATALKDEEVGTANGDCAKGWNFIGVWRFWCVGLAGVEDATKG